MRAFWLAFGLLLLLISGTACEVTGGPVSTPNPVVTYPIHSRFRAFYDLLGGQDLLGPAISDVITRGEREYQYTSKVLLVYDPSAAENQQFQLGPLGSELGISEAPMNPDAPNGHEIYDGFREMYARLGGDRFVGRPITEVKINTEANRIEQHFENAGFYQLNGATEVELLAYGTWKCADHCSYSAGEDAVIILPTSAAPDFQVSVARFDQAFIGFPLTDQYTATDGMLEQIFENVVIIADPASPGKIQFRPILGMLGVSPSGGDLTIPDHFLDFINQNSGMEYSGSAISAYVPLSDGVYRQCFANYCLDYRDSAPDDLKIRLAPLGYAYKKMYYQGSDAANLDAQRQVTMRVWERQPLISNEQIQEIGVSLSVGDQPLQDFEPILIVQIPDIGNVEYRFPPTNSSGKSVVSLNPLQAPNSTRINYEVCVDHLGERFCVADDFMIWGNP